MAGKKFITKANAKRVGIIAAVAVAGVAIVTGLGFMAPLVNFVGKSKALVAAKVSNFTSTDEDG